MSSLGCAWVNSFDFIWRCEAIATALHNIKDFVCSCEIVAGLLIRIFLSSSVMGGQSTVK